MEFGPMHLCGPGHHQYDGLYYVLQAAVAMVCLPYVFTAYAVHLQARQGRPPRRKSSPLRGLRFAAVFSLAVFAHNVIEDLWLIGTNSYLKEIPGIVWTEWTWTLLVALFTCGVYELWRRVAEPHVARGAEPFCHPLLLGLNESPRILRWKKVG